MLSSRANTIRLKVPKYVSVSLIMESLILIRTSWWPYHGWPSTQPNRIAHNLAAHPQWLGGVLARSSAICPDSNVGWPNVGPTSVLLSRLWHNVIPTYVAFWQVRLWRGSPIRVTHTTEPAHHRAAGLCAARWRAARLCVIRLGCAEGHPCIY